jgi:hypothetical protein
MTQTLNRNPATTAVIQYDRHSYVPGGIVHPSPWSPRTDPQSPDINPPSGEFVSLASFYVHEADEAETQPVIDLAAAMPQPEGRPDGYRSRHRAKSRWARDAVLYGAGWLSCAAVLLVGVHILAAYR